MFGRAFKTFAAVLGLNKLADLNRIDKMQRARAD
jgi:hypothetical protein